MQHRSTDTVVTATIKREVPLWSLLSLIGLASLYAIGMYSEQRIQARALQELVVTQSDIRKEMTGLAKELGSKNLKDVEHDLKLEDLGRRVTALEAFGGDKRLSHQRE